ncbi:unnamed protein product, partial [Gongylonema pulchrum]|uniref:SUZ domain-containing protein n=1 Tax=Gongylonema pulchrum TaxID=637853 RepID=A0A183DJ11_9BILA
MVSLLVMLRNASQPARAAKAKSEEAAGVAAAEEAPRGISSNASAPLFAAPPPADNVWEKRAEERESAERERAAQRNALNQLHLQQHFPAVGEQTGITNQPMETNQLPGVRSKDGYPRNEQQQQNQGHNRRTGNRNRNNRWTERKYSNYNQQGDDGNVTGADYYGREDEEDASVR